MCGPQEDPTTPARLDVLPIRGLSIDLSSSDDSSNTTTYLDYGGSDILCPSFSLISEESFPSECHHSASSASIGTQPSSDHEQLTTDVSEQNPLSLALQPQASTWMGFRIIGDNIDKNIKPRYYRSNKQVCSLHYYHSYALKDRIDLSAMSDSQPVHVLLVETLVYTFFMNYIICRSPMCLMWITKLSYLVKQINRF